MSDEGAKKPDVPNRRKGGRPRLPPDVLRTEITLRLSAEERALIKTRAEKSQKSLADFIRAAALGQPLTVRQSRELSDADRLAMQRIGVNLNQIAKHLNAGRDVTAGAVQAAIQDWRDLAARIDK